MAKELPRPCWFRIKHDSPRATKKVEVESGTLHAWMQSYNEFESGPGHFPAAIVESDRDGSVHVVSALDVCFGAEAIFSN